MKTWQRIFIVTVLLGFGFAVGYSKLLQTQRINARSVSNLKTISLAWLMYADDWNDKLPDMSNAQTMKEALEAYLSKDKSQAERFFVHPKTGRPYQPNSSLSYKERRGPIASANFAVIYEAEPSADGTRGVLFGDCHVERVTETRWQELKKTSNIL
jgi:hypothetical protein